MILSDGKIHLIDAIYQVEHVTRWVLPVHILKVTYIHACINSLAIFIILLKKIKNKNICIMKVGE